MKIAARHLVPGFLVGEEGTVAEVGPVENGRLLVVINTSRGYQTRTMWPADLTHDVVPLTAEAKAQLDRLATETAPPPVSVAARPLGIRGPAVEPGSPEWLRTLSASKVSTILGLSPYEQDSPFALWHLMAGTIQAPPQTDDQSRGHYLEPAIAAWWSDRHPDYAINPGGTWTHAERSDHTASPDRLAVAADGSLELLECKSSLRYWEWGTPGTDEVPVYVRAQCLWQMYVTGIDVCHVGYFGFGMTFEQYTVRYDAAEVAEIVRRGDEFMASIAAGEAPPIDEYAATYEALRDLHPDIERSTDYEATAEQAQFYCRTYAAAKVADEAHQLAKNELLHAMGDAWRCRHDGQTLAWRQSRTNKDTGEKGRPFLKVAPNLPSFTEPAEWPDEKDAA